MTSFIRSFNLYPDCRCTQIHSIILSLLVVYRGTCSILSSTAKSFGRAATYGLSAILGNSVKHWATFIEWIESNGNIREQMVYGASNKDCNLILQKKECWMNLKFKNGKQKMVSKKQTQGRPPKKRVKNGALALKVGRSQNKIPI